MSVLLNVICLTFSKDFSMYLSLFANNANSHVIINRYVKGYMIDFGL